MRTTSKPMLGARPILRFSSRALNEQLIEACRYICDLKTVKSLLKLKDININYQDEFGRTSLMAASANHFVSAVKLLLTNKDIDVCLEDKWGQTPLSLAIKYEHTEIIELLHDHEKSIELNNLHFIAGEKIEKGSILTLDERGHVINLKLEEHTSK